MATAVLGTTAALAATAAVALAQPVIGTSRGCYVVGHSVQLGGSGFAPSQAYTLTVDGVYLGSRTTDAEGGLSVTFGPGPLPAGAAQHVDHVAVSDGLGNLAGTVFTLTRPAGARIAAVQGNGISLSGRFQVWGFSLGGSTRRVYLHYISPSKRVRNPSGLGFVVPSKQRKAVALGNTRGECGYLISSRRRLFPFSPSPGTWTLQLDTRQSYSRHPGGPVARIRVSIK